ncbi:hypothetical protein QZH41_011155 [Actinostola sp. cb2023]|nr:hypothetical protein QZH41_011155 [Actinostola sp. cb2023]
MIYPFVTDCNPRVPRIGKLIRENLPILHNCPTLTDLFPSESIIPAFRRPRNLKEILSKPTSSGTAIASDRPYGKGFFFAVVVPESVIYVIILPLNLLDLLALLLVNLTYIGSTSNEFKVRFRNHKSAMKTNKKTCEVAIHFNASNHSLADFVFIATN